jgi:hypothetical protein
MSAQPGLRYLYETSEEDEKGEVRLLLPGVLVHTPARLLKEKA